MARRLSPEAKAKQRNRNAAARAPLFAWAGMVPEVTALQVVYDDLGRAIERYEWNIRVERAERAQLAAYIAMLDEYIGAENREEVIADMLSRGSYIQRLQYQLEYLCRYLATYLKQTPLAIHEEAKRRVGEAA